MNRMVQQSFESGYNFTKEITYRLFPINKNEILVRFDNLAD